MTLTILECSILTLVDSKEFTEDLLCEDTVRVLGGVIG